MQFASSIAACLTVLGASALASCDNPLGIPGAVLQPDGTYLIGEYNGLPDDAPQSLIDMLKNYKPDPNYMPRCVPRPYTFYVPPADRAAKTPGVQTTSSKTPSAKSNVPSSKSNTTTAKSSATSTTANLTASNTNQQRK